MRKFRTLVTIGALVAAGLALAPLAVAADAPTHGSAARPGPGGKLHPGPPQRGTCARLDVLFCEDFERQPLGGPTTFDWGVDTRDGTLTVERAGRAGKVLHVRTLDNGYAFLEVDGFEAPGGSFHGRLRINVDEFPTAPDWAHFTLVEVTGSGSDEVVRPLGGQFAPTVGPDAIFWGVGADGGPTGDWTRWQESAPTVEDTWQCVELEWSAPDDRVSVSFDGVPQPDLTVTGTDHGGADVPFVLPDPQTVRIGWQLYQGGATPDRFDVLVDDIALDTDPIGCTTG